MNVKAKVQEWVDQQAAMLAATQAGDTAAEQHHMAASSKIERDLHAAGHEIRDLVCP